MLLVVSSGARRDLRRLSRDVLARLVETIEALAGDPRPAGCLLLREYRPPTWRVRVGKWRVLYEIDDEAGVVTITGVRHRSKAY